jgi:ABC-type transport system involved in Fe-S cluster assembly fused permease/ATPase subunit
MKVNAQLRLRGTIVGEAAAGGSWNGTIQRLLDRFYSRDAGSGATGFKGKGYGGCALDRAD